MVEALSGSWPWYVGGPLIGLTVLALLLIGNKRLGISANLQHLCAVVPGPVEFFKYDWKKRGRWNLTFMAGLFIGGFLAYTFLVSPDYVVDISDATRSDLAALGLRDFNGLPAWYPRMVESEIEEG